VLPKADVKIFLTATPEVRAKRRTDELLEKGQQAVYEVVLKEIIQRDYQDTHREIAPLKMAKDSVKLDTSELDIEGVMTEIKKSHDWEKGKRHALTVAQQTAFISYIAGSSQFAHWLPIFTVLLGTGCRVGEAVGLRWQDCDFEENVISVNHNLIYRVQDSGKCEYHVTTPKTRSGIRIIPMLSEVKKALQGEYDRQLREGFTELEVDGYSGFIFQNQLGECLNPHAINRAIDRISKAYNREETERAAKENREPELLPHFSAHNLRHTFCTRFCENETNLKIIQEIMGHADISTTMNVYNEATREKKMESFANLEGKIRIS
jgi:integrase